MTLKAGAPFEPATDDVRMIEAPSRNTGNSVCTVVAKSSETRHLGNVGLDRIQALSQRMCRTTNLIPMLVDHYDHCALGREPLRGSKADTARSTADNGYPPIKPAHSGFPFLHGVDDHLTASKWDRTR